jgi:hypothetical protein
MVAQKGSVHPTDSFHSTGRLAGHPEVIHFIRQAFLRGSRPRSLSALIGLERLVYPPPQAGHLVIQFRRRGNRESRFTGKRSPLQEGP